MMPATSRKKTLTWLDKAVLVHVAVLILGSSWVFGGNIWWARIGLSVWASLSLPLAVAGFCRKDRPEDPARPKAWWLLPAALFTSMVIASTFNPSFGSVVIEGDELMIHQGPARPSLPSTVNSADSLAALWMGAGAYLSAFNLALVLRSRFALRMIFVLIAVNTLALSIFGTLQKLSNAGYYFGSAASPNKRYFATFIYNNHWGAFMVLSLSVAIGLLFYHARKYRGRDLWHSPFSAAFAGVILIAATAPVSASRAATGMTCVLIAVATVHAFVRIAAARRREKRSALPSIASLIIVVAGLASAIGWLGYKSINERFHETRIVLEKNGSIWGERSELYRDTWELVEKQPVFGWGLDSYSVAFQLIRPRPLQASRQYESSYATAHNDWFQSLAETGFVGTALLLVAFVWPLCTLPRRQLRHPLIAYPLLGLLLVLLYAWIEFPFHNGAFLFSFWILLFVIVRLAQLTESASRNRHD